MFEFDWDTDDWHCPNQGEHDKSINLYYTMFQVVNAPLVAAVQRSRDENGRRNESDLSRTVDCDIDKMRNCSICNLEYVKTCEPFESANVNFVRTAPVFATSADVRQRQSLCCDGIRSLDAIIACDPLKYDRNKMTCFDEKILQSTFRFPATFPIALESRSLVVCSVDHKLLDSERTCSKYCGDQPYYCHVSVYSFFPDIHDVSIVSVGMFSL
jgi:hypothetical protein